MPNAILHIKINDALKERLRELAKQDQRTLSNLVQKVLADYAAHQESDSRREASSRPQSIG